MAKELIDAGYSQEFGGRSCDLLEELVAQFKDLK